MKPDPPDSLTPLQSRAREVIRELQTPAAEEEFRARLKRQFVSGQFETARTPVVGLEPRRRPRWIAAPAVRWAAVAAAMAVVIAGGYALNRGPQWEMIGASGAGVAVVDGLPVPMSHVDDLRRRVKSGVRLRIPAGSQLLLALPGQLALQIAPATDVTVPAPPGRWFGRETHAEVRSGVLRITTGKGFEGARLMVTTPEARVSVTGTTLAVICEPEGTCVCVHEGTVEVGRQEGAMTPVKQGRRRFVYNDGRDPAEGPMREVESVELGSLHARNRTVLED
jgi:hypothetical protein